MAVYTTIDDPEAYFRVKLYTGNGTDATGITFDTTDTTMQPDLVWIKNRNSTNEHNLVNSVVGATKYLHSNLGQTETTAANSLQSFDSNGFTVGENANFNTNTNTYVAWCWKESADAGFDILNYTGNATADQDHSHSLSAVPHVIIVKNRDNVNGESWAVYHHKNTAAPETDRLYLNSTGATGDDIEFWQDTVPTSSVFTVGRQDTVNTSSGNHLAFLWSEKQGYSKFGSYTGNGDADGVFIYTGFRPAFVLFKRNQATNDWFMMDNKIHNFNKAEAASKMLRPNLNNAEQANNTVDLLSNGFKARNANDAYNASDSTYVYMAFAEAPFVNSNGVPCNAR